MPPCSALGIIRRHPNITYVRTVEDIHKYYRITGRDTRCTVVVVKKSGKLLYITCSVFKAENDE